MQKIKIGSIAALAILLLGGCASGAKFADISASAPALGQSEGRIYFYRPGFFGGAIQPDIKLNGKRVGPSQPGGFFYKDVPQGDYEVSLTTELEKKLTFHLAAGQTRYVRLVVGVGVVVGRVYPELADEKDALRELESLKQMDG